MAEYLVNGDSLTAVADAIRAKAGTEDALAFPDGFVEAVEGIQATVMEESELVRKLIERSTLSEIVIPEGVTTIGNNAFSNCQSLKTVVFPDSVTTIIHMAFQNCSLFNVSSLPDSIKSIGNSVFSGCVSLRIAKLPDNLTSLGQAGFSASAVTIEELPLGVSKIKSNCFLNCKSITKFLIHSRVVSIEQSAFSGCSSLASMRVMGERVCSLGATAFANTPIANGTGYIYVPDDLVEDYKTATNWSTYADQIRPLSEYTEEAT